MKSREFNPNINKEIRVMKVNFFDLLYLGVAVLMIMLVIGTLNIFINLNSPILFLMLPIVFISLFLLLRFANKQGHRYFLQSFISFSFKQPKQIKIYNPNGTKSAGYDT